MKTRRPDREQTSSTASRRVGPSSIKLKSFHLLLATTVGWRPRSGATSLCMLALDVPNFHMWSKRQNSCSCPLLLTTSWVSASTSAIGRLRKVMASREPKWRLSPFWDRITVRMLCENTAAIEDSTKVLKGPPCERSHHHRRVVSKQHWVGEAHFMSGGRGASRFWQTLSFLSRSAPHARSDHTWGERAYWCKLRLTLECANAPSSTPYAKNLKFLNFFEKSYLFLKIKNSEKHPFPQIFLHKKKSSFVQNSFCGNLFLFWKISFSSFSESCFMISLLCFSFVAFLKKILLNIKLLLSPFDFLLH